MSSKEDVISLFRKVKVGDYIFSGVNLTEVLETTSDSLVWKNVDTGKKTTIMVTSWDKGYIKLSIAQVRYVQRTYPINDRSPPPVLNMTKEEREAFKKSDPTWQQHEQLKEARKNYWLKVRDGSQLIPSEVPPEQLALIEAPVSVTETSNDLAVLNAIQSLAETMASEFKKVHDTLKGLSDKLGQTRPQNGGSTEDTPRTTRRVNIPNVTVR